MTCNYFLSDGYKQGVRNKTRDCSLTDFRRNNTEKANQKRLLREQLIGKHSQQWFGNFKMSKEFGTRRTFAVVSDKRIPYFHQTLSSSSSSSSLCQSWKLENTASLQGTDRRMTPIQSTSKGAFLPPSEARLLWALHPTGTPVTVCSYTPFGIKDILRSATSWQTPHELQLMGKMTGLFRHSSSSGENIPRQSSIMTLGIAASTPLRHLETGGGSTLPPARPTIASKLIPKWNSTGEKMSFSITYYYYDIRQLEYKWTNITS